MNKKSLTEADIRTKFITPALVGQNGGKWNLMTQIREESYFTKGRVIVRGKTVQRGEAKKADYILFYKPNLPIAVIEAKDNNHSVGAGMQQALDYAESLDVPFAYSSNGDAFLEHDRTATATQVTRELALDQFPTPEELWERYGKAKGYTPGQEAVATQEYYDYGSGKVPRYYQVIAINRTVDAIARGEDRILLVMATGTGKTYTAFQIIWRLWKAGIKKRILFLVDRNILADQTKINDFKPFGQAMTKITNRTVDKSFEIYLCLYQAVTGTEEEQNIYQQFADPDFDGDPVQIYEPGPDQSVVPPDQDPASEYPDAADQSVVLHDGPVDTTAERPTRYVVGIVEVRVATERVQYLDEHGKLITESLKDYSRKAVHKTYRSLSHFLAEWNEAERKQIILEELASRGVFFDELAEQVGRDYDAFDLICHIAFDQPPLTRRERADRVRKRNIFGRYGDQARAVLEALLQKYADTGIKSVESLEILKVDPLTAFGTPMEIVTFFGGKPGYLAAIRELETALYQAAA